jgi:3-oxoadipate enol-lactonase/4-carboxymuconolactone decarboxylase
MPFAASSGARIYWKLEGAEDRPALVLLNSIGTDMSLWDAAMPGLLASFRTLRIDTRGHGASDAPDGEYSLSMLAGDVTAVMDAAGIERAAIAGVSLGGMIAMELALGHPKRVSAIALICTSATMDSFVWRDRIAQVRAGGTASIADAALQRFLSPAFAAGHPAVAASLKRNLVAQSAQGYAGAGAAIRDMDVIGRLSGIACPVLVVTGERDVSTPLAGHGEKLMAAIPGASHVQLDSSHLPPIEAPAALVGALRGFLSSGQETGDAAETLFEAVIKNRRRVLGDAWVDRSLANRTPFNAEFQAMITHRLAGDLEPARAGRPHAPPAGARHHREPRPLGGVPPACPRGPEPRRLHAGRSQGGADADGDLCRRARRQHRLRRGGRTHCRDRRRTTNILTSDREDHARGLYLRLHPHADRAVWWVVVRCASG